MEQNEWLKRIASPLWQLLFLAITTIIITLLSQHALNTQAPLERCPGLKAITSDTIKDWGTDPATVHVGLQITHIPKFNVIDDRFVFEGKLWFLFDPELVSLDTIKKFSLEKGTISYQSEPELKLIDNLLFAEINIRFKTSSGLIHTAFPLDSHRIFINLINTSTSPQELIFQSDETQFIISPEVYVPEWRPVRHSVATGYMQANLDTDDPTRMVRHPKILFSIDFNRTGLRHVFIILLPLFLICAMAMMALGAQEVLGGDKALDIALAAAASIIAYRFVIESMSPHASSFMVVDYIFTFFLIVSCAQLIFSKLTYKQAFTNRFLWARATLLFVLYVIFILIWYILLFIWIPCKVTPASCLSCEPISQITCSENTFSSQEPTTITDANKLFIVGSTSDLSRADKNFGQQVKQGTELRLKQELAGESLLVQPSIRFLNDESFGLKALNNIKKLYKEGITTILSPVGSSTLKSYLPLIEDEKIVVLFPITGSLLFRKPELSHMLHYRASSAQEGALVTRHASKEIGAGRVLIIYEESPFGLSARVGAHHTIKELEIPKEYVAELSYQKGSNKFEPIITHIKTVNPDTLIFFSSSAATEELIRQLGIEQLIGKNLLGTSHLSNRSFKQFLKEKGLKFIMSSVVPNPQASQLEIAHSFRNYGSKNRISIDAPTFEAYINADIFMHLLTQIKGPITNKKIIKQAERIESYTHKGLLLSFDPETRELATTLWLDTGKDDWIKHDKVPLPLNNVE